MYAIFFYKFLLFSSLNIRIITIFPKHLCFINKETKAQRDWVAFPNHTASKRQKIKE